MAHNRKREGNNGGETECSNTGESRQLRAETAVRQWAHPAWLLRAEVRRNVGDSGGVQPDSCRKLFLSSGVRNNWGSVRKSVGWFPSKGRKPGIIVQYLARRKRYVPFMGCPNSTELQAWIQICLTQFPISTDERSRCQLLPYLDQNITNVSQ